VVKEDVPTIGQRQVATQTVLLPKSVIRSGVKAEPEAN
jgi:hypothetical protein